MFIRKAKISDLPGINNLLNFYKLIPVTSDFVNKTDISLVGQTEQGEIIAFIYCGVMAKGKWSYVNYYTIHPDYVGLQISELGVAALRQEFSKRGIKRAVGIIERDQFHNASLSGAIKLGLKPNQPAYTAVIGVF